MSLDVLKDPLRFPFEFKQWLVSYISQEVTASQITGLAAMLAAQQKYVAAAGKTTVTDADFAPGIQNGAVAVHRDLTANKTYVSVRAAGVWTVIAGPL
jgi:hypothetical protein